MAFQEVTIAVLELVGVDALFSASLVRDLSPSIEGDSIGLGRLPHRMRGVRGCANSLEYRYRSVESDQINAFLEYERYSFSNSGVRG